ncbi:FAD-dependent oxidoreductase [Sulfurimonas sp.]|nr:FAD-dependent oxidoreductase [Sulfurimonas sp.]
MKNSPGKKIAIIGGGIAGSSIALYLSELGLNVTLFETKESLVDGPPICHLHAGGNLYREISDEQCLTLLRESIELVQLYPCAVDFRPTVIAVPVDDKGQPGDLYNRLEKLKEEYARIVEKDMTKRVLGKVDDYYKFFDRESVEFLKKKEPLENPLTFDEWMIPVAKNIDLDKVQFPLIIVQEYGLNIFRLAASVTLALDAITNAEVLTNTQVLDINEEKNQYVISYQEKEMKTSRKYDYLINAAGFKSGEIDDMLEYKRERFVEFKAAYVTQWKNDTVWPEMIFYGERGTPKGMAQFTPYADGYVQLHGMTEDITLFEDGLVKSKDKSAQPQLNKKYVDKIYKGWSKEDIDKRSSLAVKHLSQFIPSFLHANIASKPLYGAQQIPGIDASLRAADVSFEGSTYARCEIVKASSVFGMADAITAKLIDLGFLQSTYLGSRNFDTLRVYTEENITKLAQKLCIQRNYPKSLGLRKNTSLML